MVDDIEMARPKGLLILFTSFKLLDILDTRSLRNAPTFYRVARDTAFSPSSVSRAASMRSVHWGTLSTREVGCGSTPQLRTDSPPTP